MRKRKRSKQRSNRVAERLVEILFARNIAYYGEKVPISEEEHKKIMEYALAPKYKVK